MCQLRLTCAVGQLSIMYFFAGVAKLNGDWLRGYAIHHWYLEHSRYQLTSC